MSTQTGPRLAITGTCEGCAWLRRDAAVWRCAHPSIVEARKPAIGGVTREPATPDGCPLLPAARLALARSVVAGDRPERSYQGPMPFVEDEDAPRSRRPSDEEEPTR